MGVGRDLSYRRRQFGAHSGSRWLAGLLSPPPSSASTDPSVYRSFIVLHLVGPIFGLPICVALLLLDRGAGPVALLFTAGVTLFWMLPFAARRGLERAALLSVQLLTALSLFGGFFYGGLNSPFSVWLIVAVLLGFLYAPRAIAWWAAGMAGQAGLFFLADHLLAHAPRLNQAELGAVFLASSVAAAFYVSLIAAFFSRVRTEGSQLSRIAVRYDETARQTLSTIAQLEIDNDQASEAMAMASHELRTALDIVIGYSEMLHEDAAADERDADQRRLERITASSRHMLGLIGETDELAEAAPPEAMRPGVADGSIGAAPSPYALRTGPGRTIGIYLAACRTLFSRRGVFAAAGAALLIQAVLGSPLHAFAAALLAIAAAIHWRKPDGVAAGAQVDALTGLPNRSAFQMELETRLAPSVHTEAALLFADLDGFKEVNDSLGHDVGDQLLAQVAKRFASICPPGVMLARLGGDEFGAAAFGCGAEAAIWRFAETMLEALLEPVRTDEHHLTVGVSIGVAHGDASLTSGKELLRRSDVAMYRAKHDKRTPICAFDVQMDETLNFLRTMREDLAEALSGDQLDLHLQPVVEARSGELASVEALLRWTHPLLGPISPAKLIALAEESGQIIAIDDWVLERALDYAKRLRTVPVAINISPVQFRHPSFARKIVDRLEAHAVPASLLRLEITEGVLVTHTRPAARAIAELREAGVKIALDDFGTGFSSLSYLKDFGFDLLKVDRSFVTALGEGRQSTELLRAITDLGHSLSMSVIAEGVENAEQAASVQLLGCDFIQGYFTGRPMPVNELESLMENARAATSLSVQSSNEPLNSTGRDSAIQVRPTKQVSSSPAAGLLNLLKPASNS